jgi:hypothetical protein
MTTSPTLSKTVNDRAVLAIITGARSDLDFTGAGHIVHCSNREERDLSQRLNGPVLIRVEHDAMHLTAEGADFILENLDGCVSKHDVKALQDFSHSSWKAYQAERLVIDQHIQDAVDAADLVAVSQDGGSYDTQKAAFDVVDVVLKNAEAVLTQAGFRQVRAAYGKRRSVHTDAKIAAIKARNAASLAR